MMNYYPKVATWLLTTFLLSVANLTGQSFSYIENFDTYGTGNLHEIAPNNWVQEKTTDPVIPVIAQGLTTNTSHSLLFNQGNQAHDYVPLNNSAASLTANVPFYFGVYYKVNALGGNADGRIRVALRIDDDAPGDQWIRQQIAKDGSGLVARIGLAGAKSDSGNTPTEAGKTIQFVVRGTYDGSGTVTYDWTIDPALQEGQTNWTTAGTHSVQGTPSIGRLFISSSNGGTHDGSVGPVRLSTNYSEVVTELANPPFAATFPYQINFQDEGTTPPDGYLKDFGLPYGEKDGGISYGWITLADGTPIDLTTPSSGVGRNRGEYPGLSLLQRTLVHFQGNDIASWTGNRATEAQWEVSVPNGWYEVTVSVGDPNQEGTLSETPDHFIQVEGVVAIPLYDVDPTLPNGDPARYTSGTVKVQVLDGKLTINADDPAANNTKVNFATVTPTTAPVAPNTAPVIAEQSFDVSEDAGPNFIIGTVIASDDDEEDALTYSITAGNDDGTFSIDANTSELSLVTTLDFETLATYALTVEVTDGTLTDAATVTINVTDVDEAPTATACSPISLLPCNEVPVSLPFALAFTGTENGLADADGELTGFTMADNHGQPRLTQDGEPTFPNVNGYEPGKLNISGGNLTVTASKGIAYLARTGPNRTNTQINTLGVGLQSLSAPFSIEARMLGLSTGTGSAQTGIWFGIDEDNFVKLNVNNNLQIELRREVAAATNNQSDNVAVFDFLQSDAFTAGQDITLRMLVNPTAGTIEAFYTIDGGAEVQLIHADQRSSLPLPQSYVDGRTIDTDQGPLSFAGVFSTYRNSSSSFDVTFDYFSITPTAVNNSPTIADQSFDISEGADAGAVISTVTAEDTDGDQLSYSITAGNDAAVFTLDATTGELSLVSTVDFETLATYTLTVQVSDGALSDEATITVNVTDVNEAPIASATADATTGTAPLTVNFDGSASSDPENGALTYSWVSSNGSVSDIATPSFTFDAAGTYTVTLTVADADGLTSEDAVTTITVSQGNTAPVLAAIGDLSGTEGETTVINISASDADSDALTITVSSELPDFATFADAGDGTATITLAPAAGQAGTYPGITVTVNDGQAIDESTFSIVIEAAAVAPCNPISLLPCSDIAVSVPYTLAFTGTENGLADADGELTGFTMVDTYSADRSAADGTPSNPDVKGYEPAKLNVTGGNLVVTATRGIAFLAPPASNNNNNQLNTLGVGLQDLSQPFSIETKLLSLNTGTGSAQAGIWFGIDEDNFVKLDLNNDSQIELRREIGGLSGSGSTDYSDKLQAAVSTAGSDVTLRLLIDPVAGTIAAFYTIDNGPEVRLAQAGTNTLALPQAYLDGRIVGSEVSALSFAGAYATYRSGAPFNATFDYFSITTEVVVNASPVVADQSFNVAEDAVAGTLVGTVVATDSDTQALTYSFTRGNEAGTFSIEPTTGAINLVGALDFDATPVFALRVGVGDGNTADTATVTVNVTEVAAPSVACSPLSTLPCDEIRVQLPFGLTFDGSATGVAGTGFTMVDPPVNNLFPATPSNPDVPGLEAGLLSVNGGKLVITSTKGINYEKPPASSNNNSQVNGLGVGISIPGRVFDISVDLGQPNFAASAGSSSQQAGLWFGLDADNFLKLALVKKGNVQKVQLNLETIDPNDATKVIVTEINSADIPVTGTTVSLRMEINPASRLASGFYSIDGNPEVKLSEAGLDAHVLPQALITGTDHDIDASTAKLTYAGVYGTHRNAAESASLNFAFDNFGIKQNDVTPTLTFSPAQLSATVREGSNVPDQVATLVSSDEGSPVVTLSDDPESVDWLILPENPTVGQLFFSVQPGLAVGNYATTVFAIADGYVTGQLDISITVTADQPIITLSPTRLILDDVVGGGPGRDTTVLLANTGNVALNNPTVVVSGAGAAAFNVDASSLPASIPAKGSAPITINFDPTTAGTRMATLTVSGDGAASATVELRGLGKEGKGGVREPSLQRIFDTYGITINVGDGNPATNLIDLPNGKTYNDLLGDEIAAPRFLRASTEAVTLEVLSVYGPESANPIVAFGYYESGVPANTNEVFSVRNDVADNGQTLNPTIGESLIFNPGTGTFGFYSRWPFFSNRILYGEDELNTFSGAIPHHVRVYALPGEANAYVIAFEENTNGFDYQDVVVIVRNVKIAPNTPVATTLRVNFSDQATAAPAGYLQDFGQAYANRGGQNYGWVVPGTSTPLSLVGNGRNRLPTPDVNTLSETLMHMLYGDTGGTNGIADPGAWEIALADGNYRVTVAAGDPDSENLEGTKYTINAEGVNLINELAVQGSANAFTATGLVAVTDGRLTLDASGGFNTKITSVTISPSDAAPEAFFSDVNPEDGSIDVAINGFQIAVSVNTPAGYELDKNTLTGNVKLFEQTAQGPVSLDVNFNDTGGGDAVILTPLNKLKNSTGYLFQLANVEANRIGDVNDRITIQTFNSTFTTASEDNTNTPANLEGVSFTQVTGTQLGEGVADRFSSLVMGPDGKLYASTTGEVIKRWTMAADGTLTNLETLTIDLKGANHPVTGAKLGDDRLIIGFTFAPEATADNLVAYVTHSALTLTDGPEWDGKLTRLSGANLQITEDILEHLPRSKKDHLTNSVVVGTDGDLFIIQGSNSAGGEKDASWGFRPERLLAAALLRVEVDKLPSQLPLSLYTTDDVTVINNAPANSITMSDGTYNPYATISPVTLYATGIRNGYDIVFHSNGWTYVPTNGTAGNNSTSPVTPASADYVNRDPSGRGVRRPNGTFFSDPTIPQVFGGETQKDWLFKSKGGSYHGHPNPFRGEFILNHGGKPYSGLPGQLKASHRDVKKYPTDLGPDANYQEVAFDFDFNKSPNGAIEYKSNAFEGKLKGMLMVVRFSGQDDILVMQPGNNNGDVIQTFQEVPGLQGLDDPLDIVEDPRTGNLYVSQYDRDGNVNQQLLLMRANVQALPEALIASAPEELIFETTVNNQGDQSQTKTVSVTNDGNTDLTITSVELTGPFASQYSFAGPSVITLAPASAQTYTITYAPTLNGSDLGYQEAALTFASNGNDGAPFAIGLHGLKKAGFEGGNEPAFQDVVDALGIGINVGWTTLASSTSANPVGDEVLVPLFEAAGPGNVGITAVARYSPAETLPFGWYTNNAGTVTLNEVAVQADGKAQAQTLYPQLLTGTESFDPQGAFFGIYVKSNTFNRVNYSEDDLNTGGVAHRTRIYPTKDRSGKLVPNSYLIAYEDASNGDYQDYVYVLTNVKPYEAGAQVLSFNPNSIAIQVQNGETSASRSSVLSASSALGNDQVTLSTESSWVVLPATVTLGQPIDFAVNSAGLANGTYEADVIATAPGFAPATLKITAQVTEELVYFARINFQDNSFTAPTGYTADTGLGYGARGNGQSYGWINPETKAPQSNVDQARGSARGITNASNDDDKLLRSLNMFDKINTVPSVAADWEIAVPNGTYLVEVAVGDPSFFDSRHVLRAEGVNVINGFVPSANDYFAMGSATVEVTDGKLTLDDVGATANGNTKIIYANISTVSAADPLPTVVVNIDGNQAANGNYRGPVTVTLTATDNANSGGIQSLRYSLDDRTYYDYTGPIDLELPAGFTIFDYQLRYEAIDGNDNSTTGTKSFTLVEPTGALVRIENMTKVPGTNRGFPADDFLTFHRLNNPVNRNDETLKVHDRNVLRVHNDGTAPLVINSLSTTDATDFTVVSPAVPNSGLSVAPGQSVDVTIEFVTTGGANARLITEQLLLVTNADNGLTGPITLRGAYMRAPEGGNEITAQQVFNSFGFSTEMGRNANGDIVVRPSSNYPSVDKVNSGAEGDMVLSDRYVQADPSKPLIMMQLSALHGPGGAPSELRLRNGQIAGDMRYNHGSLFHQTLLPNSSNTSGVIAGDMVTTLSEEFEIMIAGYRSSGGTTSNTRKDEILGLRVYRAIDRNGKVIPNEYILNQDYIGSGCGEGSANCDWNDNTSYIINARPAAVPTSTTIENLTVLVDKAVSYPVATSFNRGYAGNRLLYSAALAGGGALPSWINLSDVTGTFAIEAPVSAFGKSYTIAVTATDYNLLTTTSSFVLTVEDPSIDCTVEANADGVAKELSCEDGTVVLNGQTSTGTYRWTGPNGFVSELQNPTVSVAGTYELATSATDGGNCPLTSSVEVTESTTPLVTYYADADGDGFGDAATATELCAPAAGFVTNANDCDDNDAALNPGAAEICDGIDNNCDGRVDEGLNCSNEPVAIRINAGGPTLSYLGETFEADANFTGGKIYTNASATVPALYQTERSADAPFAFNYAVAVPNGEYTIRLHFAEIYFGATGGGAGGTGKRIFDVSLEGGLVLDNYDINGDVGPQTATVKEFNVSVTDNVLNLLVDASPAVGGVNQPKLSALEIISGSLINEAPVAVATANPVSGVSPLSVSLNGSQSTDSDGTIASYAWVWNGGSATGVNPDAVFTTGTYQVTLTVTDNDGASATDVVAITATEADDDGDGVVNSEDNCPTVANPDQTLLTFYADVDGDGFGDPNASSQLCAAEAGFVSNSNDCDDTNAAINPNAIEVCDGVDNNCDGQIDEGLDCNPTGDQLTTFWLEAECAEVGAGWRTVADVDASNGQYAVFPQGNTYNSPPADIAANRVRFTVDAAAGAYKLFARVNAPTAGDDSYYVRFNDGAWFNWNGIASNGFSWSNYPGPVPTLRSGINTIDFAYREDGTKLDKLYLTQGNEVPTGFGESASNCGQVVPNTAPVAVASATPTSGTAPLSVQFDGSASSDSDGTIATYAWAWNGGTASGPNPSATFAAGNYAVTLTVTDNDGATGSDIVNLSVEAASVDTDNDGIADENDNCPNVFNPDQTLTTYYADRDGDSYGDPSSALNACEAPLGYVTNAGDCNDNSAAINPAATEVCDGVDNNCDGQVDEGLDCNPTALSTFWLEAECATVGSNWTVVNSSSASKGKYAVVLNGNSYNSAPNDVPANRIRFTVDAAEGNYTLFARTSAANTGDDSFWVRVNGNAWYQWNGTMKTGVGFAWNKVPTTLPRLVGGVNTIDFAFREDGTQLDKVYLTTGTETPTGLGQDASNCGTVVANQAPVARAAATPTSGTAPLNVQFNGQASTDADGTIANYAWAWNGGSASGVNPRATFATGTYAVTLTVTDNQGATATDVISITATRPNDPTTVSTFWLEAECARVGSAWTVQNDANASEGKYAVVLNASSTSAAPTDVPANRIRFTLDNAKAGNYNLYGLISAPNNQSDSYWVRVNGGEWIKWNSGIRFGVGFQWNRLPNGLLPLLEGTNTLDFAYRENGAKLDKVHLNLSGTSPSGKGLAGSNCGATGDADGDGVADNVDNCPTVANADQQLPTYYADFDGDGYGDPNDFVKECVQPANYVTNALDNCPAVNSFDLTDSDGNGIGDACEPTTGGSANYWLEAECATVGSGWLNRASADASGGRFVSFGGASNFPEPTSNDARQQVRFTVNLATAATYRVFLRMSTPDAGKNSFWVRVDAGPWIKMWKALGGRDLLTNGFEWRELNDDGRDVSLNLTAGNHTITVANREAGTILDKIALTTTTTAPIGTGDAATNCGSMAASTQMSALPAALDRELETELSVFPNPTVDELTLDLTSDYNGRVVVRIFDVTGRQLRELNYDKDGETLRDRLNVSDLARGVYRLHVIEGDRQTVKPFIKM